ncbi:hypothetical protein AGMMS50276_27050 [Synergistales bacterium]|nr:hypothetical protein AGMMS50276_27050 [Synergistales bacterium]
MTEILVLIILVSVTLAAFLALFLWEERGKLIVANTLFETIKGTIEICCWKWTVSNSGLVLIPDGEIFFGKNVSTTSEFLSLMHPDDVSFFKRKMEDYYFRSKSEFQGNARETFSLEFRMQSVYGQWRWFMLRDSAAKWGKKGKLISARGAIFDINKHKQTVQAANDSEKRLNTIFRSAAGSMAVTDPDGNLLDANRAFCDMLDYNVEDIRGIFIMSMSEKIYDQKQSEVMEDILMKCEVSDDMRFHMEENFKRRDGKAIVVDYSFSAIRDFDGNIVNYIFAGTDVTLQKERAVELNLLAERQSRHAEKLQKLHLLVYSLLQAQNREHLLEKVMAYLKSFVPNSSCNIYFFDEDKSRFRPIKMECLASYDDELFHVPKKEPLSDSLVSLSSPIIEYDKGGLETRRISPILFQSRCIGVVDISKSSGMTPEELEVHQLLIDHISGLWMLYDILALREREASVDPLTGIWNRRYILQRLQEENDRITRYGGNACIAIGDLGNFKNVNDNYGHSKGDEVLIKSAVAIKKNLRLSDSVGRYGGDEFILMLSNVTKDEANIVLGRIQQEILNLNVRSDDSDPKSALVSVTLDFGAAFFPGEAPTLMDTIGIADELMYTNKIERKKRSGIKLTRD